MSINLLMFFVFATICAAILDGVLGGSVAIATTSLTSDMTETAVTANVDNASAFPQRRASVIIDGEIMCFDTRTDTTLSGLQRGKRCGEDAKVSSSVGEHVAGARVYNEASGLLNEIVNINIGSNFADGGIVGTVVGVVKTVFQAPKLISIFARMMMWDFGFFEGPYVYVKYIMLGCLSAGLMLGGIRLAIGR